MTETNYMPGIKTDIIDVYTIEKKYNNAKNQNDKANIACYYFENLIEIIKHNKNINGELARILINNFQDDAWSGDVQFNAIRKLLESKHMLSNVRKELKKSLYHISDENLEKTVNAIDYLIGEEST